MKSGLFPMAAVSAMMLVGGVPTALADSASATCEVRKEGETRQGASGPCTFSQRQGHINLDLRNGDSYSLMPGDKQGHYHDQKGNKVVRTISGDTQEFKWEGGKKIIVTYTAAQSSAGAVPPPASGGGAGESVPALQDLVGARGGDGEAAMRSRGYTWVGTDKSGADAYSYWRENENGQCVTVRTSNGRYASIAYATDFDCKHAAGAGGAAGTAERRDEFGTVCGVIVSGQTHRYRCTAVDVYSGSNKVRTELRYPDQTIELTWRPGNRVGLQFEGMVPKEARYATSEGETNFVFEGKTYFYYSNKDIARMELQHFRD